MNKLFTVINIAASILAILTFFFGNFNLHSIVNMNFIKEYSFFLSLTVSIVLWTIYLVILLVKRLKALKCENASLHRRIDNLRDLYDERISRLEKQ